MILATGLINDAILVSGLLAVITLLVWGIKAIVNVTRVIDGQLEAMHDNTHAVKGLTEEMGPLRDLVHDHDEKLDDLDFRVRVIEGPRGPRGVAGPAGVVGKRGPQGPEGHAGPAAA